MLETMQYSDNAFVTLTYSDDTVPLTKDAMPTLVPRHLQLFLKRLRHHQKVQFRFFGVGEYGGQTWRPHYHLGLFNFPSCQRGETRKNLTGRCLWSGCCSVCDMVGETWGQGDIEVRALGAEKCGYLAGYVTKKMTGVDDPRLRGRHPEFSRQSRRPGVGFPAVARLAKEINRFVHPSELVDVPAAVAQGHKPLPLGRYMRAKLRLALGLPEGTPDAVLREAWAEQVLPVLQMAKADNEAPSLAAHFAKINAPYAASLQAKMNIFERGKL